MHWTLLDDFEWALGYVPKFGLASVTPETYKRVQKRSADVYKEIALTNSIPHEFLSKYLQVEEAAPEATVQAEPAQQPATGEGVTEPAPAGEDPAESQPPQDAPTEQPPVGQDGISSGEPQY
jgi:hypothetical protein